MKIKFYLVILLCFTSILSASSQIPSYVPQNGLVGYWPFDGSANDISGNGNNGTVSSANLTSDRFGNPNKAYNFDGTNSSIQCINAGPTGNPTMSVCFWLKSSQSTVGQIFGYGSNAQSGQDFRIYLNGQCSSSIFFDTYDNAIAQTTVLNGNWDFYTLIYDGALGSNVNSASIYKNGVLLSNVCFNVNISPTNITGNIPITFGRYHGTAQSIYYSGDLDDIGIWNRALTQQEITNLYNAPAPNPIACNPLPTNLITGLVGYWPFCGNANDESGNSHNGTVSNATLSNDRFGNLNSAYYFDGIGDFIRVNHANDLKLSGNFSISCWANLQGQNPFNSFISKASNNQVNVPGWIFGYLTLNQISYVNFQGSPTFLGQTTQGISISNNQWYNATVTYDSASSQLKYYLNGLLTDSFNIAYDFTGSSLDVFIGNHFTANDPNIPVASNGGFTGLLDDIGIWNRVLSPGEINQINNQNICYQTITVTDTLLINVNLTGFNPVTYQNTIKVFPNPTNDHITIDFGTNYASLNGYSIRIDNTLGQSVFTSPVQQQAAYINLSSWTGVGVYFIYLLDSQNHVVDVRKIVLQ
jgi:hypothetical protein